MFCFVSDLIHFVLREVARLLFEHAEDVEPRRPLHLLKPLDWDQRR